MQYKAVIVDIDGTLVVPTQASASRPSQKVIDTVKKVKEKGVYFSIATGRSLDRSLNIVNSLQLNSPIILDNGALIYDCKTKKYIWESLVAKEAILQVGHLLEKEAPLKIIIYDDNLRLTSFNKISKWRVSKILILDLSEDRSTKLHKKLKAIPNVSLTRSIVGHAPVKEAIHVTNIDATKQVGVHKLAQYLNIATSKIIGIGDSYNDFSLLMACGLKVAMGNATDDIKAIADYIAPTYWEDGVAYVLEKFILK